MSSLHKTNRGKLSKVEHWLESLGLARYADAFTENEVDWEILPELTNDDLKTLEIPLGPRKKLLKAISQIDKANEEPTSTISADSAVMAEPDTRPAKEAERRHLTVVFCDLIGSTELAAKLDPEDLNTVLRNYQECVSGIVKAWDGHVARYMGDGVLAYFGYPRAHEDDAERAVRASIEVTETVRKKCGCASAPLATRVGVATGLVMVGDLIGEDEAQERTVVGETPNLAARLQALAAPNSIVIAPNTRRLLGDLFEFADLGSKDLKGFSKSTHAWKVIGASTVVSRFEALHATGLTPLVGRAHEIGLLRDRFELACGGEGQAVLLCGEPGIGKSRIAQALQEYVASKQYKRISYYCSPYHTNSALHPVIDQLKRAAEYNPEDSADANLDRLQVLLSEAEGIGTEIMSLFAALCSIHSGERFPPINLTPQAQKERTLAVLIEYLSGIAVQKPLLLILEDAHWIDPTTAELFGQAIDRIQYLPVMILVTFRPEFSPPWTRYAHVTSLTLSRLGQRQGTSIIGRLTAGKALPPEVLEQILQKTDGVPLFIEELTKTVLESGLLVGAGDHYELSGPLPPLAIPTTLHDSLMARLDSLAPIKEIAQIGAVIGREFGYKLIAAISSMPEVKLQDSLQKLVNSELVFCRGCPPEATYSFKHALVQDAAYQSLLKSRLHQLHARIAELLEERFPDIASTQPELIAHHCTEADLTDKAIDYWRIAGEQAARRAASPEAVQHFQRALNLLESQPEGLEHDAAELKILVQYGPALMLAQGWAAAEAGAMYQRASELARRLENAAELVPPLVGSWLYYQGSAQFDAADETTCELFEVAHSLDDPDVLLQALHAAWPIPMLRGAFSPSYEHIEKGLRMYDYERHRHDAFIYMGHDPGVCGHALGAVVAWNLGFPERANRHTEDAVQLAHRLGHPPSLALALWFISGMHAARGDSASAFATAEELSRLSEEQKLVQTCASAQVIGGWAMAHEGQAKEGIKQLQAGLAIWHRMGARHYLPPFTCLLAESCIRAERYEEALKHLNQALAYCNETGERWWEARIHQTRGRLFLHMKSRRGEPPEDCFQTAMQVARAQGAKGPELRAATGLAYLRHEQGKHREAHDVLAPIYGWFTEGINTTELKEAKALLDELP